MKHTHLIEYLADQASLRIDRGLHPKTEYGLAIHIVCQGDRELKKEVGRVLNKRGQASKDIKKLKEQR